VCSGCSVDGAEPTRRPAVNGLHAARHRSGAASPAPPIIRNIYKLADKTRWAGVAEAKDEREAIATEFNQYAGKLNQPGQRYGAGNRLFVKEAGNRLFVQEEVPHHDRC
jgi:hypothetical protein